MEMNKKILSIFFLLFILASIAFAYSYFNQKNTDEKHYDNSTEKVSDGDIVSEIDDMFLEENNEVEIGEMI